VSECMWRPATRTGLRSAPRKIGAVAEVHVLHWLHSMGHTATTT
jgi:hypothetical protein